MTGTALSNYPKGLTTQDYPRLHRPKSEDLADTSDDFIDYMMKNVTLKWVQLIKILDDLGVLRAEES